MKYTFIDNGYFVRQDSEKVYTILMKKTGLQFYVNPVGKMIFDLLKDYSDTEEILTNLYKTFANVDEKIIKSDFLDVLDLFLLYNVVQVEEANDEVEFTETPSVKFAGDGDYRKLLEFIKNKKALNKCSFHSFANVDELNPVSLRYTSFHNINYFCMATDDKDKCLGVISLQPPSTISSVIVVDGILFSQKLKRDEIKDIFEKMIRVIIRRFDDKLTKIRINVLSNSPLMNNKEFKVLLNELGFTIEVELKHECANNSLIMHTRSLI